MTVHYILLSSIKLNPGAAANGFTIVNNLNGVERESA